VITVAVVNHGNYLGRGKQYVETMRAMVARNLTRPHQFVCLEDVGTYGGWWAKIELFRPGRFSGRVLYLDLDSVVVGPLDELVESKGIVDLLDWGWRHPTLCSSVMVWDGDEHAAVFERFTQAVPREFRGDQDWITHIGGWPSLPPHLCKSYRYHSVLMPPARCVHVSMHGNPKPHEIASGWVKQTWRE
jgi:hypothetical protein